MSRLLCASIRALCEPDHRGDSEAMARWTENKTPEHLGQWLENPNLRLFIAERHGEPAGVGGVSSGGTVVLAYVAPEHRFAGVSRALLEHADGLLSRMGHASGRLTSTVTAHRFYLDRGWRDSGRPTDEFGLQGRPMKKSFIRPEA